MIRHLQIKKLDLGWVVGWMLLVEVPMALLETTLGINTYKSLLDPPGFCSMRTRG
jgi:hypothetical protein